MKKTMMIIAVFAAMAVGNAQAACDNRIDVQVNGLVCDFCAQALDKVFSKRDEVADIEVDLDNAKVVIHLNETGEIADDVLTNLITDSGYNVVGIDRGECVS